MNRNFLGSASLAASSLIALCAFQAPAPVQAPPKPEPKPVEREEPRAKDAPLRFTGLPGPDKEKLVKEHALITAWLEKELNRKVEFVPVADEAAAIAGLASNEIDMIWVTGVGAVRAEQKAQTPFVGEPEGETNRVRCRPICAREGGTQSKSYFIAKKKLVEDGTFTAVAERKPMPLAALAALKPKLSERTIIFGAKDSSAGSIMPRYYLALPEVAIDAAKGFKKVSHSETGDPAAVLSSVASGASDLGVVDSAVWEAATDEEQAQAPVIYVTPESLDHCMVIHYRLGPGLSLRLMSLFIKLDPKVEAQKAVLDMFGAKKFVEVGPKHLEPIRAVVKSAKESGILE